LAAVSKALGTLTISPVSFELDGGAYSEAALQSFADQPPAIMEKFAQHFIESQILPLKPRLVGLSCIGQEQLPFTLLFGRLIKQLANVPVIVGGTILARIYERGVLPVRWFERYFDIVVRNEGERPAEALLLNNRYHGCASGPNVPGIIYADTNLRRLIATEPSLPLRPQELPVPDFSDLPLNDYFSNEITLPVLASRGCYWGKCEFCHHGMVYGEKYAAYDAGLVLSTIESHAEVYGVRNFSFNDEAIPPKIARKVGEIFPPEGKSGWAFTGLIKFEKFYVKSDFENLRRIGFRSMYVGLESASERVLKLMHKPNHKSTLINNLRDATESGIWMHCFLFFGFPGELEEDAQETFQFIIDNSSVIGSFGCGEFSLEHNAPIFRHLAHFPIKVDLTSSDLNVYYKYTVSEGITARRASEWTAKLNAEALKIPKYFASSWIPREHLLSLLSQMPSEKLVDLGQELLLLDGIPPNSSAREVFSLDQSNIRKFGLVVVNRANRRVFKVEGAASVLLQVFHANDLPLSLIRDEGKTFYQRIVGTPKDLCSATAAL
jgi:radical SAM superfamily enzyme YgiQ (UPF0313 family)